MTIFGIVITLLLQTSQQDTSAIRYSLALDSAIRSKLFSEMFTSHTSKDSKFCFFTPDSVTYLGDFSPFISWHVNAEFNTPDSIRDMRDSLYLQRVQIEIMKKATFRPYLNPFSKQLSDDTNCPFTVEFMPWGSDTMYLIITGPLMDNLPLHDVYLRGGGSWKPKLYFLFLQSEGKITQTLFQEGIWYGQGPAR